MLHRYSYSDKKHLSVRLSPRTRDILSTPSALLEMEFKSIKSLALRIRTPYLPSAEAFCEKNIFNQYTMVVMYTI